MARYINKYTDAAAIKRALENNELSKPYVAYDESAQTIDWNTQDGKIDYSKEYLTFEILSAGTITWLRSGGSSSDNKTIEYKKNDGEWTSITSTAGSSAPTISVNSGDNLKFRGLNNTYYGLSSRNQFKTNCEYNIYGNILSLVFGDSFTNETSFTANTSFREFFYENDKLIDASNLIMPQNVKTSCYYSMFYGCTSLTSAPELPATTLVNSCYQQMFFNCANLNYIKCLAEDISASNCTYSWVYGVAATGTFIKTPSMSSWTSGNNGIPSKWTVQDAQ